ncbi:nicotinate phosphoribosyltransferase [Paenibacillus sp. TRM 82003]|nr:nicotinate phosphoribosyltransferase [Kineococcus sp. TRM81007]MCI2239802.1 nicotinate phosphoribosyltransferase [Kineococcus sp. TRM81007]MCI3925895.1 nicotinate phosphoribosyltransferase [Paenibacillus sp. TRM 82003]
MSVSTARGGATTALLTDHYELTMLQAALADGTAERRCTFEVFGRRLPEGRRYGVVAGVPRVLDAVRDFRFEPAALERLRGVLDERTLQWLAAYRFTGSIEGYAEGELWFPGSPLLTVTGTFAEAVVLETVVLSILNHDCAIAAAAARMSTAARGRPLIEMGSRRTHEEAAVTAARAAYLCGFTATSNLAAGERYGIPTAGTSAHAFTLLHDTEEDAFRAQVAALGTGTTLLVDTYDITRGIETAIEVAGPELGAVRIDSGDLAVLAVKAREQLDSLGATATRVVVSGDLDEYALAALAAAPVDGYGVGTSLVTGSGAPTAGLVYKLVEVEGRPVAKRSTSKVTQGGRKVAVRRHRATGTATDEVLGVGRTPPREPNDRPLQVPYVVDGERVPDLPPLADSREHLRRALVTLPWDGLALSKGDPAIPTTVLPPPTPGTGTGTGTEEAR